MRYADISGPTETLAVPDVPALPIGLAQQREYQGRVLDDGDVSFVQPSVVQRREEEIQAAQLKLLDEKSFDPDAFLKAKLANSTEYELKSLQSSLRNTKDETAADLQKNVFKNYAEFVHISKEISALENEMIELKDSLSEWKSMPSLLHIDESSSASDRRRNVRSSVADLRVLYASQMQTLHTQIEGSAKFVPTTPGRHVIAEMDTGVVALHAATYKVAHPVRFVLLDDAVLVARRRNRRNADGDAKGGKWVAERAWPLTEMIVLETKDTPTMTNVFKIRSGKETHVYRTEQAADKKNLLSQFRHIADEFAARRQKEREGEHERRKSLWTGGDRNSFLDRAAPAFPEWMADLAKRAGMADGVELDGSAGSGAKEKAERDARWVSDWADELTVAVALREFDKAVKLVEEGEAKASTIPSLSPKLTALTASLTSALLSALSDPSNRKTRVVSLISLLKRVHAGAAARDTFLKARSVMLKKHLRMIKVEGDAVTYVHDLAIVVFSCLKHTADWFLASFRENEFASAFVDWARKEITHFADIYREQVYGSDNDAKVAQQASKITYSQSRKLLEEFGLDFRYLLDELLVADPKSRGSPRLPAPIPTRVRSISIRQGSPGAPAPTPRSRSPALSTISSSTAGTSATTPATRRMRSPSTSTTTSSIVSRTKSPAPSTTSTAPTTASSSSASTIRTRSPAPPVPALSLQMSSASSIAGPSTPSPGLSPVTSRRMNPPSPSRSQVQSTASTLSVSSTSSGMPPVPRTRSPGMEGQPPVVAAPTPVRAGYGGATSRLRPGREAGSPAPPPRSRDRPGSAASQGQGRAPPVAVAKREGMF